VYLEEGGVVLVREKQSRKNSQGHNELDRCENRCGAGKRPWGMGGGRCGKPQAILKDGGEKRYGPKTLTPAGGGGEGIRAKFKSFRIADSS